MINNIPLIVRIIVPAILLAHLAMIIYFSIQKKGETNAVTISKLEQMEMVVHSIFGIAYLLLISCGITTALNPDRKFLMNLSGGIILTWIVVLVGYYAWAIYFYNINLGWSDEKWQRYRHKQKETPGDGQQPPEENPYIDQTFGLPPGTVRGTIALSLVVIAMALTIASISMDSTLRSNVTLVDNFDFIKKAFLMMIAFYFGSKSLEILQANPPNPSSLTNQTMGAPKADKESESTAVPAAQAQKDFTDPNAEG